MRKALYLMGLLEDRDIQWMVEQGSKQFVPRGTRLITEGTPVESLFIVLDGHLSVETAARRTPIAVLQSGEIVGEISFVDLRLPSASVTAMQDCLVLGISRTKLRHKLDRDAAFAARFYRAVAVYLADHLRVTSGRLGYGDAAPEDVSDEMDDVLMDNASTGAMRFDNLLHQLSIAPNGAH